MNMKKILVIGGLAIVAVVAGALIYLSMTYSSYVKAGVETYGPQFTKTEVKLGGVDASPFAGEVSINQFLVGNPSGFKTSHAFKVRAVKVAVDVWSITGDSIHIKEIVIDAPDIIYELGGGGSNLQTIQKNVGQATGGKDAKQPADADKGEGPKVIIDNLYIRNANVAMSASMLGGKTVPVPVPDIHLKDIGKDSKDGKGASVGDVAGKVMDEITGSVTKAASAINLDDIKKQAEGLTKGVTDGVGGATKGVTDGIKGLFGK
ncbi:MAG: hypothetical protein R3229_03530 [Alphaproteobacteria bacterium]|nr:hypothetical protein [Alphaproteobacteria bacterium]